MIKVKKEDVSYIVELKEESSEATSISDYIDTIYDHTVFKYPIVNAKDFKESRKIFNNIVSYLSGEKDFGEIFMVEQTVWLIRSTFKDTVGNYMYMGGIYQTNYPTDDKPASKRIKVPMYNWDKHSALRFSNKEQAEMYLVPNYEIVEEVVNL